MKPFVPNGTVGKEAKAPKPAKRKMFEPKSNAFNPTDAIPAVDLTAPVNAWSASTLKDFETCKYRVYLAKVKKIKTDKAQADNTAANRGLMIHDQAEQFVDGRIEKLPADLKKFKTFFLELRELYGEGVVQLEEDWGFTQGWAQTGWMSKNVWLRMKLDGFVMEDETSARVIDHKTGKKWGNEVTHGQQAIIYALGAFKRYPLLENIRTEFWYLDKGETLTKNFTRDQSKILMPRTHARGLAITEETHFTPSPSAQNCKFCNFREEACQWAEN